MGILIWFFIGIIYIIAQVNGRTGRMYSNKLRNNYGRYGVLGMPDDFSLEFDPLEDIRNDYNQRLHVYYNHNQPKTYLINKDCEARLIKENNGDVWFYVKAKTRGKLPGAYFEVRGDNNHVSTMWAIIDMEFNSLSRYYDLKDLYYKLNHAPGTNSGLKYFHEPFTNMLPKPITNKMAQNEYCRMEIQTLPNGEKVIVCSEIWGNLEFDKPRRFVIKEEKLVLYGILSEFSKNRNKMQNYLDLLHEYSKREDCTVKEINDDISVVQNTNSAKKLLEDMEQKESAAPAKTETIEEIIEGKEKEEKEEKEIKKYNERNLDL